LGGEPREGDTLPDMELTLSDGSRLRLSELRGKIIVLYFYPKAFTPGCSREASAFNELYEEFKRLGAEVIGVSTDSPETNSRFASKKMLRFQLASDSRGSVCKSLGVLRSLGPLRYAKRVTLVVDREGRIARVIKGVRPEEHAYKALEAARMLAEKG